MDEMLSTSRLFPFRIGADPLYEDYEGVWDIRLAHDQDGYALAFRFDGQCQLRALLSEDDAKQLGLALLSAGTYAAARNHLRGERN